MGGNILGDRIKVEMGKNLLTIRSELPITGSINKGWEGVVAQEDDRPLIGPSCSDLLARQPVLSLSSTCQVPNSMSHCPCRPPPPSKGGQSAAGLCRVAPATRLGLGPEDGRPHLFNLSVQ